MVNAQNKFTTVQGWSLVRLILVSTAIFFFGLLLAFGYTEEGIRQLIRWSGRVSVSLFCMAFAAKGLQLLLQNAFSRWILNNRKYLGVSFAIVHLAHLIILFLLQAHFHPVFHLAKMSSLLSGGLAYFFIVLMLLTSFPYFSKRLSQRNWKRLHTTGGYWIWFIFMTTYWKRALTEWEYLPIALLLVVVFLIRMYALIRSKWSGSIST